MYLKLADVVSKDACHGKGRHARMLFCCWCDDVYYIVYQQPPSYWPSVYININIVIDINDTVIVENLNWRESADRATTTTWRLRCDDGGGTNDVDAVVVATRVLGELCWCLVDGQTHRHSRHHRGTGPVKSDEEGHLIYKDGDVLCERCTNHHHHIFVAVMLQTLASFCALHCD